MGAMDIFFILLGLTFVALGFYFRFLRSLAMLLGTYIASLSAVLLYREAAYRLQAIGGVSSLFDGIVFLALFFLVLIVFLIIMHVAYPDMSLPKLGFVDSLLGGLVGIVVGILSMAMLYAGFSVIVSQHWDPYASFASLYSLHAGMRLGPILRIVRSIYAYLFYPFFINTGFPPVFTL